MADAIIMPQLGETVAEGKILAWYKSIGDDVKVGDKLFEVETDKVTVEVEAIAAGKLSEIKVAAGVTAKVGATVATIGGAAAMTVLPQPAPNTASPALSVFEEVHTPVALHGRARAAGGLAISPLARRLMAESGAAIDPIIAYATDKGLRRVRARDVRAALAQGDLSSAVLPPQAAAPPSAIRQKTAERLAENWRNIPHVFQTIDADFTRIDKVRLPAKSGFKQATGFALTYLPFIARAVCLALRDFPNANAIFDGRSLSLKKEINLGIAVDLSHNGLVVPVVKQAGDLTVEGLAKTIARLADKARANKLTADDLSGGTYSITNNGAFGTLFTSPIINAPQVAILSTDAIRKRPVVVSTDEGDFIAARTTGILGQSFDHRAFDGAYAASFLSRLKQLIETHNWSAEISRY